MDSLMNSIIQKNMPSYWSKSEVSYSYPYVLIELDETDYEYHKIYTLSEKLDKGSIGCHYEIDSIYRVQHPWAFASYQLRRSQMFNNGLVAREYYGVSHLRQKDNLNIFLSNNCDVRTLKNKKEKLSYIVITKCFDCYGKVYCYPDYVLRVTGIPQYQVEHDGVDNLCMALKGLKRM